MEPIEFGKYLLLQQIGTGRIGQVWKAKVLGVKGLEKFLAIKRLHPHLSTHKPVFDIFLDTASSIVQLQHDNIVRIYDFGSAEGTPYIAMDFILGKDLSQFTMALRDKGQALAFEEALHIAIEVCKALDFAHSFQADPQESAGITHAGLRPQNVLITLEGQIKLTDFCISRALFEGLEDKRAMYEKTLPYLAPEVAKGEPFGPAMDVFCLGVLLCELVTGRPIVEGPPSEVFEKMTSGQWNPSQMIPEDLTPMLQDILAKAIAYNPQDRYETAGQLLNDLEAYREEIGAKAENESLAGYMKSLFGEELAKSAQGPVEMEGEGFQQSGAEKAGPPRVEQPAKATALFKKKAMLGACLGILLALAVVLLVFWPGPRKKESTAPQGPESTQVAEQKPAPQSAGPEKGVQIGEGGAQTTQAPATAPGDKGGKPLEQEPAMQAEAPQATAAEQVNPKLHQAMDALGQEKYAEAARLFGQVLREDPELGDRVSAPYAEALVGEAVAIEGKEPTKAKKLFLKAAELNPENVEANFHLGLLYVRARDYAKAIDRYNKVTQLDPQYADAYFNMGYAYAVTRKWKKAEQMYEQVVRLAPPYLDEALFNLAMVQKRLGKKDACIENLKRAVIVNPENKMAKKYLKKMTGK